jgi:hypothetical protein
MVGLEALSMQGLPVDKLLLTRETEDQLADLAGNAMSTTVVGACILAALVSGKKLLKAGDDLQSYEHKNGKADEELAPMDIDAATYSRVDESQVVGEDQLEKQPLDLSITHSCPLPELLAEADKSKRLCGCEGRLNMTTRPLFTCQDCRSSFCKKCGGRPEHNPLLIDNVDQRRIHPSEFSKNLKSILPMCLTVEKVDQSVLDNIRSQESGDISNSLWTKWSTAVIQVCNSELRFVELKRQEIWSVVYQSPAGFLELSLHPRQPEWRLFANPKTNEPANAEIRQVLQSPVARFICEGDLLKGKWQFALPHPISVSISIQGMGDLVPSWESRLGLVGDEFKNKMVYPKLKVSLSKSDAAKLDLDVSGVYVLLDKCGTANGALHRRIQEESSTLPPLFLLFDPHRTNDSEDCFVFTISTRRLEYQEHRPIICKLDPSWRQSSTEQIETVAGNLPIRWTSVDSIALQVCLVQIFLPLSQSPIAHYWTPSSIWCSKKWILYSNFAGCLS